MAATEADIIRDEQERGNLQRAAADLETAIAVSNPGTRRLLEQSLAGIKARVATLDKRIEKAKAEHAAEVQTQATRAAALAAKEAKLSEEERETYRGFLEKAFFTKQDFGGLARFYAHSYDRLSEGGKEQMSHRVWEGIRRDEYQFGDLPKEVQEKEARFLSTKLNLQMIDRGSLANIPEADRMDFLHARESGDTKETAKVLGRESFRRNVALETSTPIKHQAASVSKPAVDDALLLSQNTAPLTEPNSAVANQAVVGKLASINLEGLDLQDSKVAPSSAAIPNAADPSRASGRSLV